MIEMVFAASGVMDSEAMTGMKNHLKYCEQKETNVYL